jgi:hypothetical protein
MGADEEWLPSYGTKVTILLTCAFIGAGTNLFIAASHKIEDARYVFATIVLLVAPLLITRSRGVKYMFISVTLMNESLKFTAGFLMWLATSCGDCRFVDGRVFDLSAYF